MLDRFKSWTMRNRTERREDARNPEPAASIEPPEVASARAVRLIETGPHPKEVFFCAQAGGRILSFNSAQQTRPSLLLFSSPYYAIDYLNHTAVAANVAHAPVEALPRLAAGWIEAGAGTCVLNRCPRCDVALATETQQLRRREDFLKLWAVDRVTRALKGEQLTNSAFALIGSGDLDGALSQLREIRDHVDCGVPQVHHFIALLAEMQGYQQEKASAVHWVRFFKDYDFRPAMNIEATADVAAELLSVFREVGR